MRMETTATQKFIEDAIKGGWKWIDLPRYESAEAVLSDYDFSIDEMLLTPFAWQAVGKTRGWDEGNFTDETYINSPYDWMWKHLWHRFIDHLADGKTIEESLQAIT